MSGKISLDDLLNVQSFQNLDKIEQNVKQINTVLNRGIRKTTKNINELKTSLTENNTHLTKFLTELKEAGASLSKINANTDKYISSNKELKERISQLESELKKLQKVEKDGNTILTEKQKLTERINKALSQEGKELSDLRTRLNQVNKENREASKESLNLANAYDKLVKRTRYAKNEAKRLGAEYGRTSAQFRKASKEANRLDKELKSIDTAVGDNFRNVGNYTQGLRQLGGALGVVGAVNLLANGLRDAVQISKEFELENTRLAALLNTNKENISQLTQQSISLGSSTAKTSREVLALQQAYARLGFSQKEIIGLTKGTIDGSIALNAELEATAELTGSIVNSFKDFGAEDSDKILDVLTLSTQKTALNFERLSTSIPVAAKTAESAGVSFEKLVAQLGKVVSNGVEASTAGRSLRDIYSDLAKKGLTLEQALNKINASTDRTKTAVDLFGKTSLSTALILADTTDEVANLTKELEEANGVAKEFADQTLDTLDGKLKLLNSAWEGLVLTINDGDGALGTFAKDFVQFFTDAITQVSQLGIQIKLLTGNLDDLSSSEFQTFLQFGELDGGLTVNKFLQNLGLNLEKVKEEYTDINGVIKNSFGTFVNPDTKLIRQTEYLEKVQAKLFQSLVRAGESQKDAADFAKQYVDFIKEQAELSNKVVEGNKNITTSTDEQKNSTDSLTGAIEKQRKVVRDLQKQKEKAAEKDIALLNYRLDREQAVLKKLEESGKEEIKPKKQILEFTPIKIKLNDEELKQSQEKIDKLDQELSLRERLLQLQEKSVELLNSPIGEGVIRGLQEQIKDTAVLAATTATVEALKQGKNPQEAISLGAQTLAGVKIYEALAGFHDGGYTGDGSEYQVAGLVHRGENVNTAEQVDRYGMKGWSAKDFDNAIRYGYFDQFKEIDSDFNKAVSFIQPQVINEASNIDYDKIGKKVGENMPDYSLFVNNIGHLVSRYKQGNKEKRTIHKDPKKPIIG